MIKRRFYKLDHADRDGGSSSSSSSSESELEPEVSEESGDGGDDEDTEVKADPESGSSSSGYKSEDSSVNEVGVDSSDSPTNEDNGETEGQHASQSSGKHLDEIGVSKSETIDISDEIIPADALAYILKSKSVYKCRLCPRIVCLTTETLKAHLNSKRHSRSEKLLNEGRLKAMLNSDGEIENQETAAELHARIVASAENIGKKKNKGRQRQRKRSRTKKMVNDSDPGNATRSMKHAAKKQRKK